MFWPSNLGYYYYLETTPTHKREKNGIRRIQLLSIDKNEF